MEKLMGWVGATVVSGIGWWLGARNGMLTAFLLSIVGTGVGFYVGRRWAGQLLG